MKLSLETTSCFWRSASERLSAPGLLSTAECLHGLLRLREQRLGLEVERLDDLLFFFALRLRLVIGEYALQPERCCPWCTERQRRLAVHEGNARASKRAFALRKAAWQGHLERMQRLQACGGLGALCFACVSEGKKALRRGHGQKRHQESLV